MQEKIARIIEMIEQADSLFKGIEVERREARELWDSGIEKLAAAIWICEREPEDARQ